MPWQGDPDIRIDRFDGRALLEYLPDPGRRSSTVKNTLADELNFERYHDLVEAERLEGDISIPGRRIIRTSGRGRGTGWRLFHEKRLLTLAIHSERKGALDGGGNRVDQTVGPAQGAPGHA